MIKWRICLACSKTLTSCECVLHTELVFKHLILCHKARRYTLIIMKITRTGDCIVNHPVQIIRPEIIFIHSNYYVFCVLCLLFPPFFGKGTCADSYSAVDTECKKTYRITNIKTRSALPEVKERFRKW